MCFSISLLASSLLLFPAAPAAPPTYAANCSLSSCISMPKASLSNLAWASQFLTNLATLPLTLEANSLFHPNKPEFVSSPSEFVVGLSNANLNFSISNLEVSAFCIKSNSFSKAGASSKPRANAFSLLRNCLARCCASAHTFSMGLYA